MASNIKKKKKLLEEYEPPKEYCEREVGDECGIAGTKGIEYRHTSVY